MTSDAPAEGGRDVAMLEIKLSVTNPGLGVVHGGLRGALVCRALVDRLRRSGKAALQGLGAGELAIGEFETRDRGFKLRVRLREPDLVRTRINREEEAALLNDVAVSEMYLREGATHLRAQLDLLDRGELAKEPKPGINLAQQRLAHHHFGKSRRRGGGGYIALTIRIGPPCSRHNGERHNGAGK
jgi:hypothetical protein